MDQEMYDKSKNYEILTRAIYQSILKSQGTEKIEVQHNQVIEGRSGVGHQIDVLWQFRIANIEHKVIVECKDYATTLTLGRVRDFFGVVHDIGNVSGIIVTKVGFQSGAVEFAEHYGINLKLLRKPSDADWAGRVKNINISIVLKGVDSSYENPLRLNLQIRNPQDKVRLDALEKSGLLAKLSPLDMKLLDSNGVATTEEFRYWIPGVVPVFELQVGGPYKHIIKQDGMFINYPRIDGKTERIELAAIEVEYYIKEFNSVETEVQGDDIVKAILKDYSTGKVEHVHRSGSEEA
ncbi:MAG: restriction endonuclease [Planctomycetes bacterium]|nr:restriction endonuclease [Planctomycetota bacterium]